MIQVMHVRYTVTEKSSEKSSTGMMHDVEATMMHRRVQYACRRKGRLLGYIAMHARDLARVLFHMQSVISSCHSGESEITLGSGVGNATRLALRDASLMLRAPRPGRSISRGPSTEKSSAQHAHSRASVPP